MPSKYEEKISVSEDAQREALSDRDLQKLKRGELLEILLEQSRQNEAMKIQLDAIPLLNALFCEVNPIPVKKAMEMIGWNAGPLRLPLVEMTAGHAAMLKAELDKMGCKI